MRGDVNSVFLMLTLRVYGCANFIVILMITFSYESDNPYQFKILYSIGNCY